MPATTDQPRDFTFDAAAFRQARKTSRLSQAMLARIVGCSPSTISRSNASAGRRASTISQRCMNAPSPHQLVMARIATLRERMIASTIVREDNTQDEDLRLIAMDRQDQILDEMR
jgi:hypothetical protein